MLPPMSESPAPPEVRQCPQLRYEHRYEPPLRRLSLPPLANDHGSMEHNKDDLRWEHEFARPHLMQHQQHLSESPTERQLSSTDVPEAAAYVNSEGNWPAGHGFRMVKDEEKPRASERTSMHKRQSSGTFDTLLQALLSELVLLDSELRCAGGLLDRPSKAPDVAAIGLQRSLKWALQRITFSICQVKDLGVSRSMPVAKDIDGGAPRHNSTTLMSSPVGGTKRTIDVFEKGMCQASKRACPRTHSDRSQAAEWCRDFPMQGDGQTKQFIGDNTPLSLTQPSRQAGSSTGSTFMQSQSPMQASSSIRALPSPSSFSFSTSNVLPPISPCAGSSQAAHAAHLQDLQHQISTKTLALQTLQREHDSLLAAFSRSQIRCATLEKKFQVSDAEINTLTEERIKLLSQIEAFETQVEELIKSREEARKQSVANGGQYMKIMAMASRLEAQGAADKKKWMSEREEWEREREGLRRVSQTSENKREERAWTGGVRIRERGLSATSPEMSSKLLCSMSRCTSANYPGTNTGASESEVDDVLASTSPDDLRSEVVRLRQSCHDMEVALQDLRLEGQRIDQVMQEFGRVGKRIATKALACIRGEKGSCGNPVLRQLAESESGKGDEVEASQSA
ncbi:MAG: hypothetical protein M1830_005463 [Pleopsidium flavum]|nr:MAG: hypothetical protein M1830_005463 [Pleopsidium flavum]